MKSSNAPGRRERTRRRRNAEKTEMARLGHAKFDRCKCNGILTRENSYMKILRTLPKSRRSLQALLRRASSDQHINHLPHLPNPPPHPHLHLPVPHLPNQQLLHRPHPVQLRLPSLPLLLHRPHPNSQQHQLLNHHHHLLLLLLLLTSRMADKCARCGKSVYAADNPMRVAGVVFHGACFKCKECGSKLTLKTVCPFEGEIYCKNHLPKEDCNQVIDSTMASQMNAPNCAHNSIDFVRSDPNHHAGIDTPEIQTALNAPKPPSSVNNVDKTEVMHQSTGKFS
eukprot:m.48080 g.48080  ORF g.48080 m.48080 type:complete len:282 (+) comp17741_c0_seq1:552-1397(+)